MLGFPKILRVVVPHDGIQLYIGLLVMAVAPVVYVQTDPYHDRKDRQLMVFTQLAQTVVVLCGMVRDDVEGDLADWIVTIVIMATLVPMLLVLLLYVWDPRSVQNATIFLLLCSSQLLLIAAAAWRVVYLYQRRSTRNGKR